MSTGRGTTLRILHIVGERGYSGGEHQLAHLLAHLVERGSTENRMVLQPGAAFAARADELGVPFDTVSMRNGFDPLACLGIRRQLGRHAPDLVHLADSRAHKLGIFATIGRRRAPMVVTRRVAGPLRPGRFTRWLYAEAVAAVVAVSRSVGDKVLAAGIPADRVHVIHDGVDPDRYANLERRRAGSRDAFDVPSEGLLVACAARLDPRKGQIHLVRAFRQVAGRYPEARLLLAGEGRERTALEAEIDRLELGARVFMPGRVDILDVLAAADVVCIPSLREGLSVFALEAQAAGVPVVASRTGGLVESVGGRESGWLVPPGDEAAIAGALIEVLADPERRVVMGRAGRERVTASFTARRMAERTFALYESLLDGGGS